VQDDRRRSPLDLLDSGHGTPLRDTDIGPSRMRGLTTGEPCIYVATTCLILTSLPLT
jgi:hypothetical protein